MFRSVIIAAAIFASTSADAQDFGASSQIQGWEWILSATSYATAAACAKKRFWFSHADVETLKQIAVNKAEGMDPEQVNEDWERIVMGLQFAPPTAAQCFDAFEKETFTSTSPFGF